MKYKYAQIKELPEFDKTHNLAGNLSFRIEPWAEGGLFDVIYWNEYNFGDSKVKKTVFTETQLFESPEKIIEFTNDLLKLFKIKPTFGGICYNNDKKL